MKIIKSIIFKDLLIGALKTIKANEVELIRKNTMPKIENSEQFILYCWFMTHAEKK